MHCIRLSSKFVRQQTKHVHSASAQPNEARTEANRVNVDASANAQHQMIRHIKIIAQSAFNANIYERNAARTKNEMLIAVKYYTRERTSVGDAASIVRFLGPHFPPILCRMAAFESSASLLMVEF